MSGKKEHNKGGKQYRQERKRKMSEGSVGSRKLRRNEKEEEEKELEKVDDRPTPVTESHNSEDNMMSCQTSSCKKPATSTFGPFQDHPHPPIGNIFEKLLAITVKSDRIKLKMNLLLVYHFNQAGYEWGTNHMVQIW